MEDSIPHPIQPLRISRHAFWAHQRAAAFESYINRTLRGYVDDFYAVYLDDILIFSKSIGEHQQHLELVIERLHQAELPNSTPTPRNANSSKPNSNTSDPLSTNN